MCLRRIRHLNSIGHILLVWVVPHIMSDKSKKLSMLSRTQLCIWYLPKGLYHPFAVFNDNIISRDGHSVFGADQSILLCLTRFEARLEELEWLGSTLMVHISRHQAADCIALSICTGRRWLLKRRMHCGLLLWVQLVGWEAPFYFGCRRLICKLALHSLEPPSFCALRSVLDRLQLTFYGVQWYPILLIAFPIRRGLFTLVGHIWLPH